MHFYLELNRSLLLPCFTSLNNPMKRRATYQEGVFRVRHGERIVRRSLNPDCTSSQSGCATMDAVTQNVRRHGWWLMLDAGRFVQLRYEQREATSAKI